MTVITGGRQYGLYKQQNVLDVIVYDLPNVSEKAAKVLLGARNKWRKEALKDDQKQALQVIIRVLEIHHE